MILVDTSIWIDHLRHPLRRLIDLLQEGFVLTHPLVIEELACGSIANRVRFLEEISMLPKATTIGHDQILHFITRHGLFAKGLGAVDTHLLSSAMVDRAEIWSRDRRLNGEAERLGLTIELS
ncbi:MAG: VapC toxin family PIN domain ribonuclease [Acidobacteria bacterium]|nr:VapC toxin family PIN domain ribonuclease [Acidobacteriota bacterium]